MPYIENTIGVQADGWNYAGEPTEGDARKIVTLVEGGMTWVGIRAFNFQEHRWMNNNEPERAEVKAWRDLDQPASGCWDRGRLFVKVAPGHSRKGLTPPRSNTPQPQAPPPSRSPHGLSQGMSPGSRPSSTAP